jgi:hypothetical protein
VRPAAFHLLGSAVAAGLGTLTLVLLWYPYPHYSLAGGLALMAIMLSVDIVLGPVLTLVVATPGKRVRVLARDMAVIVAIQLLAFGYGLHVLAEARPIGLVFEVDQMRAVSAADVDPDLLPEAPPPLRSFSWLGPRTFAAVKPTDPDELFTAMQLGLSGVDLAMVPRYWRDYESQRAAVLAASRPVALLLQRYPDIAGKLDSIARAAGATTAQLRFLPLRSRQAADWVTVVAEPDARIVGHLHRDGFF